MLKTLGFIFTLLVAIPAQAERISVAAAISLKDAMVKISDDFKKQTGNEIELTFGSSGQLAAQIQNGAPIDLFISAANKQIDDLDKNGAIVSESRTNIATNSLVLIESTTEQLKIGDISELNHRRITKIAVGEPKSVPAGMYTQQAMIKSGIFDSIKERLIYGTNVRQVLDYVERGEISFGIVYATDAKLSGNKIRTLSTIDPRLHDPIVYPAAIVKNSQKQEISRQFVETILSAQGQAILKEYGFTPPTK